MSDTKLPVQGLDFYPELSTAQFVIPAGAGATYAVSNNIATFTTNAAHGLTFTPAAGVMPNFYVTFGGSSSGITGTGVLINNVFRILSIPTTTTFTIYCTITAATVTSTTVIPVFAPPMFAIQNSSFGSPNAAGVTTPWPQAQSAFCNLTLAANCNVVYSPLSSTYAAPVLLDGSTTPAAGTPGTAPTWRNLVAASTNGQVWVNPPQTLLWANGTTATSYASVVI
jgi:hypothetical protein